MSPATSLDVSHVEATIKSDLSHPRLFLTSPRLKTNRVGEWKRASSRFRTVRKSHLFLVRLFLTLTRLYDTRPRVGIGGRI